MSRTQHFDLAETLILTSGWMSKNIQKLSNIRRMSLMLVLRYRNLQNVACHAARRRFLPSQWICRLNVVFAIPKVVKDGWLKIKEWINIKKYFQIKGQVYFPREIEGCFLRRTLWSCWIINNFWLDEKILPKIAKNTSKK